MADAPAPRLPLDEQVKAAERELTYRRRVYPRRIEKGQMSRGLAAYQINAMEAILETLQELATKERLI